MPLQFRAKGVSISTATNWAFNFIVGESTPWLQDVIKWRLYPMHGFYCVCSFIVGMLPAFQLVCMLSDMLQSTSYTRRQAGCPWKRWMPYLEKVYIR